MGKLYLYLTRVVRYQKGKTDLDFTEARDSEWPWHQLVHMQVYTLLRTDNNANTPPLSFTGRMPFLPPNVLSDILNYYRPHCSTARCGQVLQM